MVHRKPQTGPGGAGPGSAHAGSARFSCHALTRVGFASHEFSVTVQESMCLRRLPTYCLSFRMAAVQHAGCGMFSGRQLLCTALPSYILAVPGTGYRYHTRHILRFCTKSTHPAYLVPSSIRAHLTARGTARHG